MPLAYHVVISAYGFWLPNDPRGSGSDFIRKHALHDFGPATKVHTSDSVARRPHDRTARELAKEALRYPPVRFSGEQARAIGCAFGDYCGRSGTTVWACAILPDHAHLVVAHSERLIRWVVNQLKGAASRRLMQDRLHPLARFRGDGALPSCWAHRPWIVYLDSEADVHGRIRYAEANPCKEGKPRQRWSFVLPYPQLRGAVSGPPAGGR